MRNSCQRKKKRLRAGAHSRLKWRIGDSEQESQTSDTEKTYDDCESAESENVAKTVAISSVDPRLTVLIECWDALSDDVQDEVVRLARQGSRERQLAKAPVQSCR